MSTTERTRAIVRRYLDSLADRDWDTFASVLADDVVYEVPQSRERITGRERYVRFNQEYPGDWELAVTRLVADGAAAAASIGFVVGGLQMVGLAFFELADGLVRQVTDFWPEPYEPPPGREHLVERLPGLIDRFSPSS
ncbi:MAG: nuclear transport factor 2 family protein [Actinomycetota bacterium]|nr:nuclear transport factor 2 family protein [Actinomycetota bacterium]